jgi:hypothetical protein
MEPALRHPDAGVPTRVGHPEVSSQPDRQLCTRRSGTWRLACLASDPSPEPAPPSTDAASTSVPDVTDVPFSPAHEPRPGVSRGLAHAYRAPDPHRRCCGRSGATEHSSGGVGSAPHCHRVEPTSPPDLPLGVVPSCRRPHRTTLQTTPALLAAALVRVQDGDGDCGVCSRVPRLEGRVAGPVTRQLRCPFRHHFGVVTE